MTRRVAVPALVVAAASGVAVALLRMRRGGASPASDGAPEPLGAGDSGAEQEYRCECGQEFRVTGAGRHRVYWLPDADPSDPVLSPGCPNCDRPLPRDAPVTGAPA